MGKLAPPSKIRFWWDFYAPGKMPLKLECNHPQLPHVLATFDTVEEADKACRIVESLPIHPRMKPQIILNRIRAALQGGTDA
jgi:hypothetical protein